MVISFPWINIYNIWYSFYMFISIPWISIDNIWYLVYVVGIFESLIFRLLSSLLYLFDVRGEWDLDILLKIEYVCWRDLCLFWFGMLFMEISIFYMGKFKCNHQNATINHHQNATINHHQPPSSFQKPLI